MSVYLCSRPCRNRAHTIALDMQRCAEADTAAAQLKQQAECVGGEEARSMVQQLVGHVVTQKDKGRQAATKVTEIVAMIIIIKTLSMMTTSVMILMVHCGFSNLAKWRQVW